MKNETRPKEHIDFVFHSEYLRKKGYFASYQLKQNYLKVLRSRSPALVRQTVYLPFVFKGVPVKYES